MKRKPRGSESKKGGGVSARRSGGRRNCGWDTLYERRVYLQSKLFQKRKYERERQRQRDRDLISGNTILHVAGGLSDFTANTAPQ